MEFEQLIRTRHSVRSYTDEPVSQEVLGEIIELARTAPSSRNSRSSEFMVVTDPEKLAAIAVARDHGARFAAGAKAAIVVMGDTEKSAENWVENCCISATFIQLAAVDKGLGSCWIQVRLSPRYADAPDGETAEDYLRTLLSIPSRYRIESVITLGHPAD